MRCSRPLLFVLLAILFSIGIGVLIVSAVLDKTYYTFLLIIPIVCMCIPLLFCSNDPMGEGSFMISLGNFLLGFFAASIVGILVVLRRIDAITGRNLGLAILSLAFLLASVVVAGFLSKQSQDNNF